MWVRVVGAFLACVAAVSCADVEAPGIEDPKDAAFAADGKADAFGVSDASDLGCAVLRLANEASLDELDGEVGLSARAAKAIVAGRPLVSLEALDSAPYVGPAAFDALAGYATMHYTCDIPLVASTPWRARLLSISTMDDELPPGATFDYAVHLDAGLLNSGSLGAHGIGTAATTVAELYGPVGAPGWDATPLAVGEKAGSADSMICSGLACVGGGIEIPETGVYALRVRERDGKQAFIKVLGRMTDHPCSRDAQCGPGAVCADMSHVSTNGNICVPAPVEPGECMEPGGTYRTVNFTAEEACHTLRFLNEASWIDLRPLPRMSWSIFFDRFYTRLQWTSVAQFTRLAFDGGAWASSNIRDLKRVALAWNPDDHAQDTVADLWTARAERDVWLKDVLVTRAFNMTTVEGSTLECVEVRDDAAASRYLTVCNDVTNLCTDCMAPIAEFVGRRVRVYGGMGYIQRRWVIMANGGIYALN